MKKIVLFFVFVHYSLLSIQCFAQTAKFWLVGRNCNLDFRSGIGLADSTNYTNPLILTRGCTNICDNNGNLLFYSNSYKVYNRNYQQMPNGGNFNHGTYGNPYIASNGIFPIKNGCVIIPFVKDTNQFYMFYENDEFNNFGLGLPDRLQYLVVDKRLDGGLGDVVFKDSVIVKGDTLQEGNVYTIKHGNGKDWWVIVRKFHSNQFYMVLVDSSGPHQPIIQNIGIPFMKQSINFGNGNSSIDGSKLFYLYEEGGPIALPSQLDICDFDRCTGMVSNYKSITLSKPPVRHDTLSAVGACFSPNNRFIYVTNGVNMYQLDLQNSNPYYNKIDVGDWDGFNIPNNTYFWQMKNAPDGKIYISTYGGTQNIHVINKPDLLDTFCQFKQRQITFGTVGYYGHNNSEAHFSDGGLPNVPNYALGKITCGVGVEEVTMNEKRLTVYPNPTGEFLMVSAQFLVKEIQIENVVGQVVFNQPITNSTNQEMKIDASCFPNGIYILKVVDEKGNVEIKKFVKE